MKLAKSSWILLGLCAVIMLLSGCPATQTTKQTTKATTSELKPTEKPVIYLYPETALQVRVTLSYQGRITCSYPAYNDGWLVTAYPDGTLINQADGRTYSYLYWEGLADCQFDFSRGFVVKGCDTAAFLQEKLAFLGLIPREYNEFIVYWLPKMQDNPYNLISFQGDAYTRLAALDISPRPDSLLRVFMAYKPLAQEMAVEEQVLVPMGREGFTVVEWGGSCVP
jgi:hypothetical protein